MCIIFIIKISLEKDEKYQVKYKSNFLIFKRLSPEIQGQFFKNFIWQ